MYEANVSLGRKTDTVQSLVQALVNAAPETPLIWLIQQVNKTYQSTLVTQPINLILIRHLTHLSTHLLTHPINTPSHLHHQPAAPRAPALPTPSDTPYQPTFKLTLSTHPNPPHQHTLSTHFLIYQHTLIIISTTSLPHLVHLPYQHHLTCHINPLSNSP